jgi:two-component system chemotaxis response regulator CheY
MALRDLLHVMVVDDMSTSRGLILQSLDAFGIQNVRHSSNGRSALESLSIKPAHLVISDFNMPELNGLQLLQLLRQNANLSGIGFILITGKAEKSVIETGQKLGMNNFIKKPFEPIDLKKCIEAVVGRL